MTVGRDTQRRNPVEGLEVIVEVKRLVCVTARLVEKINRGFKFTIGEPTMRDAFTIGKLVYRGMRMPMRNAGELRAKLERLAKARSMMGDLDFDLEVAITAGRVTPEEKAVWDIKFGEVSGQLDRLVTSLSKRLGDYTTAGRGNSNQRSGAAWDEAEPGR